MYLVVCQVKPREVFSLMIGSDTGEVRILNMKPYLNFGVFKRIGSYEKFAHVRVAFDAIEWGEGVDLDQEFVYKKSEFALTLHEGIRQC